MIENSLAGIPSFMGVDYLIRRAAQEYRDRTAVIIPGERKVSFGELDERSKKLAAGLLSLGLKKEDAVAVPAQQPGIPGTLPGTGPGRAGAGVNEYSPFSGRTRLYAGGLGEPGPDRRRRIL